LRRGEHRRDRPRGLAHEVRAILKQLRDEPAIGIEILSGTDRAATAVACPLDDHEREALGERQLFTPGELPYRDGAVQQHDSWPLTNAMGK
jgi:hypothetical protein